MHSTSYYCGSETCSVCRQALPTSRHRAEVKLEKGGRAKLERAWLLLEFACALERGLAVACEGCDAAPQPGPAVTAFFCVPKNQKVPHRCFCFHVSSAASPEKFCQWRQLALHHHMRILCH